MMNRVAILFSLTAVLFGALLAPSIRADGWDKKTIFTFSEPIQVPGTVLPAGTYVFKLAGDAGGRNIVQIFNDNETQLLATVLAVPDYRDTPSDKPIVTFDERASGEPEAVQSWFYPGEDSGQEFVYPKQKATQLAQVNSRSVPSVPDQVTEPVALRTAQVTPVSGGSSDSADSTAAPATSETLSASVSEVEELPQAASRIGSIALMGVMFLAGAATLRRFATARK